MVDYRAIAETQLDLAAQSLQAAMFKAATSHSSLDSIIDSIEQARTVLLAAEQNFFRCDEIVQKVMV